MTIMNHAALEALTMTRWHLHCASGQDPHSLYADVRLQNTHEMQPSPEFVKGPEGWVCALQVSALHDAMAESSPDAPPPTQRERIMAMLRSLNLPDDLLASAFGLVVTVPESVTQNDLRQNLPGSNTAQVVCRAHTLEDTLTAWQAQLTDHPDITRWVWVTGDSLLNQDWSAQQQGNLFHDTLPEGKLAGEAIAITEWTRTANASATGLALVNASVAPEPNGQQAIQLPVTAAEQLLTAADPELPENEPGSAIIVTNTDFSRTQAAERQKTLSQLWPQDHAPDWWLRDDPAVSLYTTLGDTGLATLTSP